MTKEVLAYIKLWETKKVRLEREIATKKRTLDQINDKLSDPEYHLSKELKRGAVKVTRALGVEASEKPKTLLRKKTTSLELENDTIDPESVNVPAAVAVPEKQKSSWSFFE